MMQPSMETAESIRLRLSRVRLLALDVDGTLTDGTVTFTDDGRELKSFHIHDGLGIVLASLTGLRIAWITGRSSLMVERRARELGVDLLRQSVHDKAAVLAEIAVRSGIAPNEVAFMGDDWNDIPALEAAAIAIAPANADDAVKRLAHIVTTRPGGHGAVRDAIELILRARGEYDAAQSLYLASLSAPIKKPIQ
jgi:3-deoxy-D-manno-octulosonate 8-phosphate phosphatase (KDO 8-P phosphatase)